MPVSLRSVAPLRPSAGMPNLAALALSIPAGAVSSEARHMRCAEQCTTICEPLGSAEQRRLTAISRPQTLLPGETLFDESEPAEAVFSIGAGMLKLYKAMPDDRRQIIGFLALGSLIGLAAGDVYAYSAEAVTAATVCRLPRRRFEGLLSDLPDLRLRLFAMASAELAAAQDHMLLLGRKTAMERVCSFLILRVRGSRDGRDIHLPMDRRDIADYLGLTVETVSRTLTALRTSGAIHLVTANHLRLINVAALESLAEGL